MPNYESGKIYKITSGDLIYIGSTCEPTLARRLAGHVSSYNHWKKGKGNNVTSFQLIETANYNITLIELYPCGSKDELKARERFHIETTPCVNRCLPGQSKKEWTEKHKEQTTQRLKEWRGKHKEELSHKKKTYYETHKEQTREQRKIYRETHKEEQKIYREARKEQTKVYNKEYQNKLKENA